MIKLKDEFQGMIITRTWVGVGQVTFDANKVKPEQFENFMKFGFNDLFEEVSGPELFDCCNKEICTCKKEEELADSTENIEPEVKTLDDTKSEVNDYIKASIKKKKGK